MTVVLFLSITLSFCAPGAVLDGGAARARGAAPPMRPPPLAACASAIGNTATRNAAIIAKAALAMCPMLTSLRKQSRALADSAMLHSGSTGLLFSSPAVSSHLDIFTILPEAVRQFVRIPESFLFGSIGSSGPPPLCPHLLGLHL